MMWNLEDDQIKVLKHDGGYLRRRESKTDGYTQAIDGYDEYIIYASIGLVHVVVLIKVEGEGDKDHRPYQVRICINRLIMKVQQARNGSERRPRGRPMDN